MESGGGVRSPLALDGDSVRLARLVPFDLVVLVADAGLGMINDVRLAVEALDGTAPVLVALNRFDPGEELHRRNLAWLAGRDGLAGHRPPRRAPRAGRRGARSLATRDGDLSVVTARGHATTPGSRPTAIRRPHRGSSAAGRALGRTRCRRSHATAATGAVPRACSGGARPRVRGRRSAPRPACAGRSSICEVLVGGPAEGGEVVAHDQGVDAGRHAHGLEVAQGDLAAAGVAEDDRRAGRGGTGRSSGWPPRRRRPAGRPAGCPDGGSGS